MPKLTFDTFRGLIPRIGDHTPQKLPQGAAVTATNVLLNHGRLEPLDAFAEEQATWPYETGSVYRWNYTTPGGVATNKWLSWSTEVHVVRSPVSGDLYQRIYLTGDGLPKVMGVERLNLVTTAMTITTIAWQSGNTVRYTFDSGPNLSTLLTDGSLVVSGATYGPHNGTFTITAVAAAYVDVTNYAIGDATNDEAGDSPGTGLIYGDLGIADITDAGVITFEGAPDLTDILANGSCTLEVTGCTEGSGANNGSFPITVVAAGTYKVTVTNGSAENETPPADARAHILTTYPIAIPAPATGPTLAEVTEFTFGSIYFQLNNLTDAVVRYPTSSPPLLIVPQDITESKRDRKWSFQVDTELNWNYLTTGNALSTIQAADDVRAQACIEVTPRTGTAYRLTSGTAQSTLGTWTAVSDGSLKIPSDGTVVSVTGIDFSGDSSLTEVAATIQAAIRAATSNGEYCHWDGTDFIISSADGTYEIGWLTAGASGTDITGAGFLDMLSGGGGSLSAALRLWNRNSGDSNLPDKIVHAANGNTIRLDAEVTTVLYDSTKVRAIVSLVIREEFRAAPIATNVFYRYRWVTRWGEEGPPGPLSDIHLRKPGYSVNVTALETTDPTSRGFVSARLERTVAGGEADAFQFVTDVDLADGSVVDTSSDADCGEVLHTGTAPPGDLAGLCMASGRFLVGFSGREIYMTAANLPYVFVTAYTRRVDQDIVALAVRGNDIVVMTDGPVTLLTGFEPKYLTKTTLGGAYACLSSTGVCEHSSGVLFPSREGMIRIRGGYDPEVLTKELMGYDDWAALTPSSLIATLRGNHLFLFQTNYAYVIDLTSGEMTRANYAANGSVICATFDEATGQAYVVIDEGAAEKLYKLPPQSDAGAAQGTITWKSGEIRLPQAVSWAAIRVLAASYASVTVKLYADGTLASTITIGSNKAIRIPDRIRPNRAWIVEIVSTSAVEPPLELATSTDDLND